jgi:hypothetical protein
MNNKMRRKLQRKICCRRQESVHYRLLVRNLREGKHHQFQNLLPKDAISKFTKKIDNSEFYEELKRYEDNMSIGGR